MMMTLDSDFKRMASAFLNGILARNPPEVTPEERIFMDYIWKCDNAGLFEEEAKASGKQTTSP